MNRLRSSMVALALLAMVAGGCGKSDTAVPPSSHVPATDRAESRAAAIEARSNAAPANLRASGNFTVEPNIAGGDQTQAFAVVVAQVNDIPIQNLVPQLQEALRDYHSLSNKTDRSRVAADLRRQADAGIPKAQIAVALGYLFRDENSVDVKTDILNELGNLEDPSTYDQIVAGLDRSQPDEIHAAAIEELDALGDQRAIPLLQPFLTDRDEDVRQAAQSAIDSLNDQ